MAFEQQLEADRIDDFNLFSAFVRVPLLILEGVLGQQQQQQQEGEEEQSKCERSTLPKHSSETRPQDHTVSSPLRVVSNDNMSSSSAVRGGNANAKKQLGWMDKSNSYSSLSRTRSGHTSLADIVGSPRLKKNRQTSWSDESGLSLVEYLGESIKHEPLSPYHNATSTKAPAIKSAMKRSRSIRHHALDGEKQKRYIPNMPINPNSSGLVMPSRPYHGKDTPPPTGEFSPQWGWYTSLTPPSDAMYASAKSHQQHHKRSASEPARVAIPPPEIIRDENQANQVFQTLQNSHAPVGWRTSVPI
mmetsp:Transcript_27579/g.67079  ORF Transcript_27579/g.67079 Transcript_27579/m.67079 type:complete len:302 (+) Transcript_27579:80-985(+)|eukprot:CAMPEP_0113620770 /NCGR_PEP_ID=MMETSP0017_2-20120614/10592_1 /TAXON_ID=2856 /ORGANISM="Cylindrotheca closterium" /LENGTH=301 /DNA_ID=CAMNT_0000530457 /DNA_START=80 /DNA_END=985 /DNA_ORIENTATION=- /assembly_acc=CAM_ASM_000147